MSSSLKTALLNVGVAVLRAVYVPMKRFLKVQKKYLFVTKASSEPPIDFIILSKELEKRHPDHSIVMLCQTIDRKSVV